MIWILTQFMLISVNEQHAQERGIINMNSHSFDREECTVNKGLLSKKIITLIWCIFGAVMTVTGITSRVTVIETNDNFFSILLKIIQNTNYSLVINILMTFVLSFLYYKLYALKKNRFVLIYIIISLIFSISNIFGLSLYYLGDLSFVFASSFQIIFALICALGLGVLFYSIILFVSDIIDKQIKKSNLENKQLVLGKKTLSEKYGTLLYFIVIFSCWLPWLIIYYPGSITWDMMSQIHQFFGYSTLTNSNPITSTILVGIFVKIGKIFGPDNFGVFLYIMFQTIVCAFVYAYTISGIQKLKVPKYVPIAALLFYSLVPIWGAYAQLGVKDTLFAGIAALFVLQTVLAIRDQDRFFENYKSILLYTLSTVGVCLIRHNGIYFVLPALVLLIMFVFNKNNRIKIGIPLAAVLVLYLGFNFILIPNLGFTMPASCESMSIPLQQTARYVKTINEEVTDLEKDAIDQVVDYDQLPSLYNPLISDYVKGTYKLLDNNEHEREYLDQYYKVWFQMFLKHPGIYLEAFVAQNYGYYAFTPQIASGVAGIRFRFAINEIPNQSLDIHFSDTDGIARQSMQNYAVMWQSFPLIGILFRTPLYFWLILFYVAYSINKKRLKDIIALLPVTILVIGCLGVPINDELRYMLPAIASVPILTGLIMSKSD